MVLVFKLLNIFTGRQFIMTLFFHFHIKFLCLLRKVSEPLHAKSVFRCISVDMSSFENRRVVKQRMLSVISSFSNLAISNSEAQTNYYLKMPWGKQKSIFIPNGVDDTAFLNEAHFLADEGRDYLLVVGRISAAKNGPSFVNAVATLTRNRDRKIKVVWVGRLDNDEAAHADRALMDEAIGKLESEDRLDWTWAGGLMMSAFYRGAACLVIPVVGGCA